jgi:hypothetical protein
MKTRVMGQEAELVQFRKELKQLNAENVARSERIEVQFAGMCTKYDDQFAYISAQHEKMKASQDVQFQELKGFMKQLMRGQEHKEKSVSIDTLEANFGSSSKEERYTGKVGGFYEGDGFYTKSIRLEFPKFDGEDPLNWCYKAEQFFDHYSTQETQRLKISSFHMEGTALIWFQELHKSNSFSTWVEFARALQTRFGAGSYDDPMETLSKLKQGRPLEEYKKQFEVLANRVADLLEAHKLSCFMRGLKDEIRLAVKMFKPKALVDAYALAKIQEDYMFNFRKSTKPQWNVNPYNNAARSFGGENRSTGFLGGKTNFFPQQKSMENVASGNNQNKANPSIYGKAILPVQKISNAEMMERKKGLCYNCDAKWSRGHVCASPRLFLIEEIEEMVDKLQEVEVEPDPGDFFLEDFPEISLHAIIGNPTPKTIRIVGMIKNHKIIILIDSGSTHNFLDQEKVNGLGMQPVVHESIKVKVANGDEIVSLG